MTSYSRQTVKADADAHLYLEVLREFAVRLKVVAVMQHRRLPVAVRSAVGSMDKISDVVGGDIKVDEARDRNYGKRYRDPYAELSAEEENARSVAARSVVGRIVFQLIRKADGYADLGACLQVLTKLAGAFGDDLRELFPLLGYACNVPASLLVGGIGSCYAELYAYLKTVQILAGLLILLSRSGIAVGR